MSEMLTSRLNLCEQQCNGHARSAMTTASSMEASSAFHCRVCAPDFHPSQVSLPHTYMLLTISSRTILHSFQRLIHSLQHRHSNTVRSSQTDPTALLPSCSQHQADWAVIRPLRSSFSLHTGYGSPICLAHVCTHGASRESHSISRRQYWHAHQSSL